MEILEAARREKDERKEQLAERFLEVSKSRGLEDSM
jgi:hypothetical protein